MCDEDLERIRRVSRDAQFNDVRDFITDNVSGTPDEYELHLTGEKMRHLWNLMYHYGEEKTP